MLRASSLTLGQRWEIALIAEARPGNEGCCTAAEAGRERRYWERAAPIGESMVWWRGLRAKPPASACAPCGAGL